MTNFEIFTVPSVGLSLSQIIWRRYRRAAPGIIEPVLNANPGLYAVADELTPGMKIKLPVVAGEPPREQPVTLWG